MRAYPLQARARLPSVGAGDRRSVEEAAIDGVVWAVGGASDACVLWYVDVDVRRKRSRREHLAVLGFRRGRSF